MAGSLKMFTIPLNGFPEVPVPEVFTTHIDESLHMMPVDQDLLMNQTHTCDNG